MYNKDMARQVEYLKKFSPININGVKALFKNNAEHIGISSTKVLVSPQKKKEN